MDASKNFRGALAGAAMAMLIAGAATANDTGDKLKGMDSDGNGTVSAAEHAAGAAQMFDQIDADGDGSVTVAEMDAHRKASGKDAGGMSSADKIAKIDTNGDGALSAQEHADGSKSMFTKMDGNADGSLTLAEMEAGHARLMGKADERE